MWKIRFFGIDDNGFQFLTDLKENVFCSYKHNLNNNKFVEYFILIEGHDSQEPEKILEIAEKELKIYISLLKINNYNCNLKIDYPCKINKDGSKTVYAFFEDKINISDSIEVSVNGETVYSSYQNKIEENKIILKKSLENSVKRELLVLLGYQKNWINAYKIYEILKTHFKCENELKKYDDMKYFAHSANSPKAIGIENARHAIQASQNPKKIANLNTSFNTLINLSLEFIKQED
jgi:hypothetical protein